MKVKTYFCDKINSEQDYEKYKKRFIKVFFVAFTILTIIGSIICRRLFTDFYAEFSLSTSISYFLSISGGIVISLLIIAMYLLGALIIAVPISYIHKRIDMRRISRKHK